MLAHAGAMSMQSALNALIPESLRDVSTRLAKL